MTKSTSKHLIALVLVILVAGLSACDGEEAEEPQAQQDEEVTQQEGAQQEDEQADQAAEEESELVATAREIGPRVDTFREEPEELEAWLEEEDMSPEEFEELLFDISQDEAASRAYSEAQ